MNKQELINELNLARDSYTNENGFRSGVRTGLGIALGVIDQLEDSEKVVIPKFVADWIEEMKQDKRPFYSVMSSLMNKTNHEWAIWKSANMNFSEIVAQAWLDGYQLEKEKLYVVELISNNLMRCLGYDLVDKVFFISETQEERLNKFKKRFTEQEIKDYDERFWPFAVEVAE